MVSGFADYRLLATDSWFFMPFACIFVPDFPVEAVVRAEPQLREQAVAVLAGKPPLVRVFAANEKACDGGVEPGMTKLQAEASPQVALRFRSPLEEAAAHAALLDAAQSFSPCVEDTAADTVILDLAGLERLFGAAAQIARDLARRVFELGLEANVAVAANPDAALHAARGFPGVTVIPAGKEAERLGDLPVDVLLQKFSSQESGAGTQGDSAGSRDSKQDEAQRGLEILETLDRWGVRNCRTLATLPEVALSERLGQEGLRLQRMARGTTERSLAVSEPALSFEEAVELEYPVALLEPLAFLLNRLLEQLCARLSVRALATNELRLRMELDTSCREEAFDSPQRHRDTEGIAELKNEKCRTKRQQPSINEEQLTSSPRINTDERGSESIHHSSFVIHQFSRNPKFETRNFADNRVLATDNCVSNRQSSIINRQCFYTRALHLPLPMLNARTFLKLLQLELQAHPPGAPVTKVWLAAEPVRPRAAQTGLFLPLSPEPEKLELTLARIAAVVGKDRAGSPEVLDMHRPENFRVQHFAPATPRQGMEMPGKSGPLTALRLFRPPLRASVVMHSGAPVRITAAILPEVRGEIVWSAGPWCASGEWWKEEAWAREEWDIILQNKTGAALYRLYREPISGQWFVEGTYD
ncbi:MAG TPA: DNA polymerase Y family protein [Terriglobales bacterium]|nr:DNA polymerase Y family protein [Terriglobales bacterium]